MSSNPFSLSVLSQSEILVFINAFGYGILNTDTRLVTLEHFMNESYKDQFLILVRQDSNLLLHRPYPPFSKFIIKLTYRPNLVVTGLYYSHI